VFKSLINEIRLTICLSTEGPLLISAGDTNLLDPSLPDMRFIRCNYNGEETVFIPGSSLKGVFRSRYEQLIKHLGKSICNIFDKKTRCSHLISDKQTISDNHSKKTITGKQMYEESCAACRLFGNLKMGGRIQFTDAYPDSVNDIPVRISKRNSVGIDRLTGAASSGALYDFEVVESGIFKFQITLSNFARYQLALILAILDDVDAGFVSFGMGTTRGNGKMTLSNRENIPAVYRYYGMEPVAVLCGYSPKDAGGSISVMKGIFAQEAHINGYVDIFSSLGINSDNLIEAINKENWQDVLLCQPIGSATDEY